MPDGQPALPGAPSDAQIKHMVERFLGWKLPDNFNPDGGISFKKSLNEIRSGWHPVGTNLLDAVQSEEMVRYMVDGCPIVPAVADETREQKWARRNRLQKELWDLDCELSQSATHGGRT